MTCGIRNQEHENHECLKCVNLQNGFSYKDYTKMPEICKMCRSGSCQFKHM